MSDNKVTYGLEQVHIAFKGVAQTESIEVTGAPTADGNITITVTADTLLGADSPVDVIVPLSSVTHDTATKVASAIVDALNNDDTIDSVFWARHEAGVIYLATKIAQDNDSTLDISFTDTDTTSATMGTSTEVTAGTTSWGTPQAIEGAVNFSTTPEGGETEFYADNGKFFVHTKNNGYTGDLEMAKFPDEVLVDMLGLTVDSNGMLIETADATGKKFALMGQVQGDEKNRRFVYYNCKASRSDEEHATSEDSVTPNTETASLDILPVEATVNGETKDIVKGVIELSDTNQSAYDAFFDAVTLPA